VSAFPQGDQWKDPAFVESWKRGRREDLEAKWKRHVQSVAFLPTDRELAARALQAEGETLGQRSARIEPEHRKKTGKSADQARHQVPDLITRTLEGEWIVQPAALRATPAKLTKTKRMWESGLDRKAQRELACGILGGEIVCRTGHRFRVSYQCGNRYCPSCAPRDGKKLFARQANRLRFAATRLMMCQDECAECSKAIEEQRLPHWPPPREIRPRIVCATIDFTLRHDRAKGLPTPERMRELNRMIKKFCRAIEKRFRISRKEYGLAYCDELGGNNSNPHAHGIYVGPWLPQSKEKKELSELWREITGGDSFILSIKFAQDFGRALFHALKYPAKFAERSSPERLADLEKVFHRVRRFHTLAAFYCPEAPPDPKPEPKKCPHCGENLSEPRGWETILELVRRGLPDLDAVILAVNKEQGMLRAPP
jgi:hypothetical protein